MCTTGHNYLQALQNRSNGGRVIFRIIHILGALQIIVQDFNGAEQKELQKFLFVIAIVCVFVVVFFCCSALFLAAYFLLVLMAKLDKSRNMHVL